MRAQVSRMTVRACTQDCCSCCDPRIVTMVAQLSDHAELYRRFYSTEAPRAFERGMREHQAIVDELPPNSWSRETFEVYYCRKGENTHDASAKDLHRRVEARSGAIGADERGCLSCCSPITLTRKKTKQRT